MHENPPEMLSLIQETSFQFNGKDYLQTHGTAMGTKMMMAVAFANIFMAKVEIEILRQSNTKPISWKRFVDDVISIWNTSRDKIEDFLLRETVFTQRSNSRLKSQKQKLRSWTRKCTKVTDFKRTHFKPTETFHYTNFYSCHPPGVTKGFIKGEALRLLRTNSSQFTFEENMSNFKTRLQNRDYPARIVEKHLSQIKFSDRKVSIAQKNKTAQKKILPFVTQYHLALPNLKDTLVGNGA